MNVLIHLIHQAPDELRKNHVNLFVVRFHRFHQLS